jgi:hypothetical protein
LLSGFDALFGRGAAVQEAMALTARLHDVAVMREPVEQGCGDLK